MNTNKTELRDFYLLWSTQSLSQLGSAVTGFALTLWLYEKTGSALSTAMLTICTYAPYVVMSIFAGAITDRFDKKRTMLACDTFDAVLPALVIPRCGSGVLGIVTSCSGIAMVLGSLLVTVMKKPRDRVKVIYRTMLFSLGIENFMLAFSRNPVWWCAGQIVGWILVPVMGANQNVIMRNSIPVELQGRVYACRNTLQFFTIPLGLALGGFLVDEVCEPFMAARAPGAPAVLLFGSGKGSGAALMMFILGCAGTLFCLLYGLKLREYRYDDA